MSNGTNDANKLDTSEGNGVVPRIAPAIFLSDLEGGGGKDTSKNSVYQIGINVTLAAGGGLTGSAGIILKENEEGELKYAGNYVTGGGGGYSSLVIGLPVIEFTPSNGDITDIEGKNLSVGGSGSLNIIPVSVGIQYNHPINSFSEDTTTVSVGGKLVLPPYVLPYEGHEVITNTKVFISKDVDDKNNDWMQIPSNDKINSDYDWMSGLTP